MRVGRESCVSVGLRASAVAHRLPPINYKPGCVRKSIKISPIQVLFGAVIGADKMHACAFLTSTRRFTPQGPHTTGMMNWPEAGILWPSDSAWRSLSERYRLLCTCKLIALFARTSLGTTCDDVPWLHSRDAMSRRSDMKMYNARIDVAVLLRL
ncbi:hypothetical protein QE152_g38259 [Popillia japonica]|uniref:Uncharacterized protein n=1 Tax=Popillia japonica TaxID=7064 RepID=A0AAW1I7B6_POPJA